MSIILPRPRTIDRPTDPPRLNRDSPQARGLKFWVPVSQSGFSREIVTGETATNNGPVTWNIDKYGWAANVGLATDAFYLTYTPSLFWPDFTWQMPVTISFWNYVPAAPSTGASAFGNNSNTGSTRLQSHCPWSDSNVYWDYYDSGSGTGRISTSYSAHYAKWTLVHLVHDPNTFKAIYFDGKVANSATSFSSGNVAGFPVDEWFIGRFNANGTNYYHRGLIFDFRIRDYVVPPSLIAQEFALATRWNLYWRPRLMVPGFVVAAPAPTADVSQHIFETQRHFLS